MILKTRTIQQYENEKSNIIICDQEDKIQREGVQSIFEEKKLLERKGIGIYQKKIKPEDINDTEITEVNKYNESLDIIDDHRAEQEAIEYGKNEFKKIKEETEKTINNYKKEVKAQETIQETIQE